MIFIMEIVNLGRQGSNMGLSALDLFLFGVQVKYISYRWDNTSCLQSKRILETAVTFQLQINMPAVKFHPFWL